MLRAQLTVSASAVRAGRLALLGLVVLLDCTEASVHSARWRRHVGSLRCLGLRGAGGLPRKSGSQNYDDLDDFDTLRIAE